MERDRSVCARPAWGRADLVRPAVTPAVHSSGSVMGLLSSVHESRSYWTGSYSLKDPALAQLFGSSAKTDAGIVVTDEMALMCAAVFQAVNVLSSDVAKAPLNLLKRRQDGGSDHYLDSKTYHLLKTEPNPEMGSMVFRQT